MMHNKPHSIRQYLDSLQSQGVMFFTRQEYQQVRGISEAAAKLAIMRAHKRGEIATPYRGFHIIVPPTYRALGSLPAEQFVPKLMSHLGENYYVGLLSAAALHGASHHAPQEFQIVVKKGRPDLHSGKVRLTFVSRNNLEEMPTLERKTPTGYIRVATPELTAFDLISYSTRCGGLDMVATILADLVDELDTKRLFDLASKIGPVRWVQRLGYVLQLVGASKKAEPLVKIVKETQPRYSKLDPQSPLGGEKDKTWRLKINTRIEPDL